VTDIRFVCLSDLHFGAENSLLSRLTTSDGDPMVDSSRASDVLVALIDCLKAIMGGQSRPPTLVLCGDVLELALANDDVAATVFMRFVELAFARDEPLFDDVIYFIPGNHDHHLWEGAREQQYADYVRGLATGEPLRPPWHVTRMYGLNDKDEVYSEFLGVIAQRATARDVKVRVVYPNFAVRSRDGARVAVFHHGHYVESMYRLMSKLRTALFPTRQNRDQIWDWEADNFAWIDFLWSTLGRSGDVGTDVGLIYSTLQDGEARLALVHSLVNRLASSSHRVLACRPARWALGAALGTAVRRSGTTERLTKAGSLSPSAQKGLAAYVEGPLRKQLEREAGEDEPIPDDVVFVFGHTHKPFEERRMALGYPEGITIYNTGGWVVDSLTTNLPQGAAVVLLDDDLHVASLRMYNQAVSDEQYKVEVHGEPPLRGTVAPGPLAAELGEIVRPDAPPWSSFSLAAAAGVRERQAALHRIIDRAKHQLAVQ